MAQSATLDQLNNEVTCSLVMSKSYLDPKETSILQLELLSAVTAVKMNMMISRTTNNFKSVNILDLFFYRSA